MSRHSLLCQIEAIADYAACPIADCSIEELREVSIAFSKARDLIEHELRLRVRQMEPVEALL